MGLRYRKSINLGGGFKINLSKSGVGYSFGTKGLRYTKTASGRNRSTMSIPGTGVSYVKETGSQSNNKPTQNQNNNYPVVNDNYYDTQVVENASANTIVSEGMEELLSAAKRSILLYLISLWVSIISAVLATAYPGFIALTIIGIICLIIARTKGVISLEYTIDDYQRNIVEERLTPLRQIIKSNAIWRINQTSKVKDSKYTGGATNSVKRTKVKTSIKAPFPFKADVDVVCFLDKKEKIVFLPDKLVIIQGAKIGALDYADLDISYAKTVFLEPERVPSDAVVVGQTWKYVNKSGGPDKRFSDNKQIPECSYGLLGLDSQKGVDSVIMFSNPGIVNECNNPNIAVK